MASKIKQSPEVIQAHCEKLRSIIKAQEMLQRTDSAFINASMLTICEQVLNGKFDEVDKTYKQLLKLKRLNTEQQKMADICSWLYGKYYTAPVYKLSNTPVSSVEEMLEVRKKTRATVFEMKK